MAALTSAHFTAALCRLVSGVELDFQQKLLLSMDILFAELNAGRPAFEFVFSSSLKDSNPRIVSKMHRVRDECICCLAAAMMCAAMGFERMDRVQMLARESMDGGI